MTNALTTTSTTNNDLATQMRFADSVASAGMLPPAYRGKPADILLAVGLGQAMGLTPAESLWRIDVIQGTPTASAELIAANVRKAGHKLRVEVDERNTSVTATVWRADDPDFPHVVTRDMAWAQKMGLSQKDNYKKQPLTMLQWRAISGVARLAASEALYGVAYTADEIRDGVPGAPGTATSTPVQTFTATPVDAGEAITDEQAMDLAKVMAAKGIAPDRRVGGAAYVIGRDIDSLDQLTQAEYDRVLDSLEQKPDAEQADEHGGEG